MLPGHLRLYALARCTSLVKKSLIYSMTRAKNERNNASEQIKEGKGERSLVWIMWITMTWIMCYRYRSLVTCYTDS